jgi:hypothetical protein
MLLLLPLSAWADVGGRISGWFVIRAALSSPAQQLFLTMWATRPNKPQPPTTNDQRPTTNDQGQYSFRSLRSGGTKVEIDSPGFQPYKKTGVGIDVTAEAGLLRWFNRIQRGHRKQ